MSHRTFVAATCNGCNAQNQIDTTSPGEKHWECPQNGSWVMGDVIPDSVHRHVLGTCSKCGETQGFHPNYSGNKEHQGCSGGGTWTRAVDLTQWHQEYEFQDGQETQTWTRRPFGDDFVVLYAFEPGRQTNYGAMKQGKGSICIPRPSNPGGFDREGGKPDTGCMWAQDAGTLEEAKEAADKAFADRALIDGIFWREAAYGYRRVGYAALPALEALLKLLPDTIPLSRHAWEAIDEARQEAAESRRRLDFVEARHSRQCTNFGKKD